MAKFQVIFHVQPSFAFGLPTDGYDVVPEGVMPTINFDWSTHLGFMTREDGSSTTLKDSEKFRATFAINGVEFQAEDNIFKASLTEIDVEQAVSRSTRELTNALSLLGVTMAGPSFQFTPQIMSVIRDGVILNRNSSAWHQFFVFNNEHNAVELKRIAANINGLELDGTFLRSIRYFTLGDALLGLLSGEAPEDQHQAIVPLRFLQYWKALTAIVGDPSATSDYQSRPKKLGLGRQFYRQKVKPLTAIRDNFDVAHIASPTTGHVVSPEETLLCRETACIAIWAYLKWFKAGGEQRRPW